MPLTLSFREATLASLDQLDADALALFIGPERPLVGLAGLADWRLCGSLSRAIRAGHFEGVSGETMLMPSAGRLPAPRVFCFGVGNGQPSQDELGKLAVRVCEAMGRARSVRFALTMPPLGDSISLEAAASLWLAAIRHHDGKGQVILGDARVLLRAFEGAAGQGRADVHLDGPPTRVEVPSRPAPVLSGKAAVLR